MVVYHTKVPGEGHLGGKIHPRGVIQRKWCLFIILFSQDASGASGEPWWRGLAFRNWLNEILKTWKGIKSLGSSSYLTKKPDKRGKDGCSCVSIVWLSGEKLGQLTSTFIHFLCEKGRTVIYWEDGWEEVCGKLKSLKQPLWWIREGAKFLLCCSVSVIPYTTLPWNVALAGRLLFLSWNMFEMFAEPVHWVSCIRSNCHKYIAVFIRLLISALQA